MTTHRDDLEAALRFLDERREERDREGRRALGEHLLKKIDATDQRKQEQHQSYLEAVRHRHGLDSEAEEEDGGQE